MKGLPTLFTSKGKTLHIMIGKIIPSFKNFNSLTLNPLIKKIKSIRMCSFKYHLYIVNCLVYHSKVWTIARMVVPALFH